MERFRKTLSGLIPSGTRDVSSSPVQLTMEMIPDPEEEDCTMGEDEWVHLIQHPSSYTDGYPPASHINVGELNAFFENPLEHVRNNGPSTRDSHVSSGEDVRTTVADMPGGQLAGPRLDNLHAHAIEGYKAHIRSLEDLISHQNTRLYVMDSKLGGLASHANAIEGYKAHIRKLEDLISRQNTRLHVIDSKLGNLASVYAKLHAEHTSLIASHQAAERHSCTADRKAASVKEKVLANNTKISDGELKSHWKQLKFSIRNLSLLIAHSIPEDRCPSHSTTMKNVSRGNKMESSRRAFENPNLRRWAIEKFLWLSIHRIVFMSQSHADSDADRRSFRDFKKFMLQKLNENRSTRLGPMCKWFNEGWEIIKPSDNDVDTMLQKDCGQIYTFVHGEKPGNDGADEFSIQDDLRDIFTLAVELDDMCMQSRAMIAIFWHDLEPRERGSIPPDYQDDSMDAVNRDQRPAANAKVSFTVTPALLKKGNASGRNYHSQMVLAKADVVMDGQDDDGVECGITGE